jgi:hypothetical protein
MLCRRHGTIVGVRDFAELNGMAADDTRRLLGTWKTALPEEPDPSELAWRLSQRSETGDLASLLATPVTVVTGEAQEQRGTQIQDALLGSITIDAAELPLINAAWFQVLRSARGLVTPNTCTRAPLIRGSCTPCDACRSRPRSRSGLPGRRGATPTGPRSAVPRCSMISATSQRRTRGSSRGARSPRRSLDLPT